MKRERSMAALMRDYGGRGSTGAGAKIVARGTGGIPADLVWRFRNWRALTPANGQNTFDGMTLSRGSLYFLKARVGACWYTLDGSEAGEDADGSLVLDPGEWQIHEGEDAPLGYTAASTATGSERLYIARLEMAGS